MNLLTILAIVVPAIVSIIAMIVTIRNNRANIQARRSEIAFEKKLEAYREIIEKMEWFNFSIIDITTGTENNIVLLHKKHVELANYLRELTATLNRNNIYISGDIALALGKYQDLLTTFKLADIVGDNYNPQILQQLAMALHIKEDEAKSLIQKTLGLDK